MYEEMIPDVGFSDNANQRTPCILVLDGSASMSGEPIDELNRGLKTFEEQLKNNPLSAFRVQVLVIQIGGWDNAEVISDWCDAVQFTAPILQANGSTPLGNGMALALEKIEEQKRAYDANGITSTRPWIIVISDGVPNDVGWKQVAEACRNAEQQKKVVIYPIGTASANFNALGQFSNKSPKKLSGLNFNELFIWLSRSMSVVSNSSPGDKVQLPATGWEEVEV